MFEKSWGMRLWIGTSIFNSRRLTEQFCDTTNDGLVTTSREQTLGLSITVHRLKSTLLFPKFQTCSLGSNKIGIVVWRIRLIQIDTKYARQTSLLVKNESIFMKFDVLVFFTFRSLSRGAVKIISGTITLRMASNITGHQSIPNCLYRVTVCFLLLLIVDTNISFWHF